MEGWREGEREPGEGRRGRGDQMDGRMEARRERGTTDGGMERELGREGEGGVIRWMEGWR